MSCDSWGVVGGMRLKAEEIDIQHSHPNEMVYFVTRGKVHLENGEPMGAEFPGGFVLSHDAWTHG